MTTQQLGPLDILATLRTLALLAPNSPPAPGLLPSPYADEIYGILWTKENRVSSGNMFERRPLLGLPARALTLDGTWVRVDGKTALNGRFEFEPFANPEGCRRDPRLCMATVDGFDQTQLYSSSTELALKLEAMGFDVGHIIGKGLNKKIVGHANATPDLNAWFSPQNEELTFGTSNGKWNLASDNDVTKHEGGHFVLHRQHPGLIGWYSGEGGAIHEGFGDFIAASIHKDPDMGEDFLPATGKPENINDGLRRVENNLILEPAVTEVHDRGRVYGGFFWGLKKKIEQSSRQGNEPAEDIMFRVLVNHGAFYTTNKPRPTDFVKAVIRGAEALASAGKLGVDIAAFKRQVTEEAKARGMIRNETELQEPPEAVPSSVAEAMRKYAAGDTRLSFELSHTSTAIGGRGEIYQQVYTTRRGEKAKVVATGMFVHYDRSGRLIRAGHGDVRTFGPTEVNEEIRVSYEDALRSIEQQAGNELARARVLRLRPGDDPAERQMNLRIAEAAVKKAKELKAAARAMRMGREQPKPTYVILPDGKNANGESELYYEFKMGLSLYYVNARDARRVIVQRDVLRDARYLQ